MASVLLLHPPPPAQTKVAHSLYASLNWAAAAASFTPRRRCAFAWCWAAAEGRCALEPGLTMYLTASPWHGLAPRSAHVRLQKSHGGSTASHCGDTCEQPARFSGVPRERVITSDAVVYSRRAPPAAARAARRAWPPGALPAWPGARRLQPRCVRPAAARRITNVIWCLMLLWVGEQQAANTPWAVSNRCTKRFAPALRGSGPSPAAAPFPHRC